MWSSSCSVNKQQVKCEGLVGTPTDTDYEEVSEMKHWAKGLRKIYLSFSCSTMIFRNTLAGVASHSGFFSPISQDVRLISLVSVFSSWFLIQCHVGIVILVELSTRKKQQCLSRQRGTQLWATCIQLGGGNDLYKAQTIWGVLCKLDIVLLHMHTAKGMFFGTV